MLLACRVPPKAGLDRWTTGATWSILLLASGLLFLTACETPKEEAPQRVRAAESADERKAAETKRLAAAIVVWTDVDPLSPAARGLERLIEKGNEAKAERWVSLEYVPPEDLERRLREIGTAELPPDEVLLGSARLIQVARLGRVEAWDDAPQGVEHAGVDLYAAAWKTVQADGHTWGIPICGETRLRLVRTDSATSATMERASIAETSDIDDVGLARFLEGRTSECTAGTADLVAFLKHNPPFAWRSEPVANGRPIARESFRTLALARPRGTTVKPLSVTEGFLKTALSTDAVFILWRHGSQVPVRRMPEEPQFLGRIHFQGPWIGEWE